MRSAQTKQQPLDFLKLLAHDIRWRILLALSRSDRKVEELVKQLKQPHNLISYHLKLLRHQNLVSERRSSADGRDIYYSLNINQFRTLYFQAGTSVHPALVSEPNPQSQSIEGTSLSTKPRVLFLCTHNSARSQMAEAILRQASGDQVEVFSAGNEPTPIHPLAIQVMSEIGIDITDQQPKHLDQFLGQHFDYIVTVCDRVRESCPVFPGDPEQIHWSFPDPSAVGGDRQTREKAFSDIASQLKIRIEYLLLMIKRSQEEEI
jgi:ArsR family transcriptional regulator, arsenate/arsenite/antimonite-responsive transcriptional repressor / arsenate reductase (thioredoxin)